MTRSKEDQKGLLSGFSKKDVERIEIDPVEPPSQGHEGFRFDVWRSGLTVYQVMDIAERNDIPIARDGLITISKNFKADMSRKYASEPQQISLSKHSSRETC